MRINLSCLALLLSVLAQPAAAQRLNLKKVFAQAARQTTVLLAETDKARNPEKPALVVPRTEENGQLKLVSTPDWTSGFFAGNLWFLYQATGDKQWLTQARRFTQLSEPEKLNTTTHDLGFMIYCPFGNGYRLAQDAQYREVIIQAARSLSTRFSPTAGVLKSWDHHDKNWQFPVIIDNMMNLELLFEATRLSGDSAFYCLAVTHANTTLRNHYRPDFSSYHVVDYDPQTGAVRGKMTAQGYADASAWARGQAWGLYGFTMCYRETRNPIYLQQAEHIAQFILHHPNLPPDKVPYWDYNDPTIPNAPRDVSAAAIAASALYELSTFSLANGTYYRQQADVMLHSLQAHYAAPLGKNHGFLLLHSTGHKPAKSEIDTPLIYADYYYLEALLRARDLAGAKK
ncbi:MAG: glucuronyl hydrolase [Hymenobacter sp.]|nr:glucuronyl hydrolase [Hymenobacter sp.]